MRLIRLAPVLASAALLIAPFGSAHAIERNLLTWSGKVDREVVIQICGRDVATRGSGLDASFPPRVNVNFALPRAPGVVRVLRAAGRGDVDILENPSARNNYTATVRVRDRRAGADNYRIVLTYEANDVRGFPGDARNDGRNDGRSDERNDRGDEGRNDGRNDRGNDGRYDGRSDRGNDGRYDDRNRRGNDRGDYDRTRRDAGALQWSGQVDGVAEIRIQGGRVDALAARGNTLRNVRYDVMGAALPRRDVRLEMARQEGRGTVRIVQQPSVWNGYVAIVRIDDGRRGYGAYSFDIRW